MKLSLNTLFMPQTERAYQGCSPKKEVRGRLKQDLDNDLSLTLNINSVVLKVSYTAFQ